MDHLIVLALLGHLVIVIVQRVGQGLLVLKAGGIQADGIGIVQSRRPQGHHIAVVAPVRHHGLIPGLPIPQRIQFLLGQQIIFNEHLRLLLLGQCRKLALIHLRQAPNGLGNQRALGLVIPRGIIALPLGRQCRIPGLGAPERKTREHVHLGIFLLGLHDFAVRHRAHYIRGQRRSISDCSIFIAVFGQIPNNSHDFQALGVVINRLHIAVIPGLIHIPGPRIFHRHPWAAPAGDPAP